MVWLVIGLWDMNNRGAPRRDILFFYFCYLFFFLTTFYLFIYSSYAFVYQSHVHSFFWGVGGRLVGTFLFPHSVEYLFRTMCSSE